MGIAVVEKKRGARKKVRWRMPAGAVRRAREEGWYKLIRTLADRRAVCEGCYYDPEAAEEPIEFIERFVCHGDGPHMGEPVVLLEWEKEFIREVFG